eukprot:6484535-Amphidinium_carterae.1
MATPEEQLRAGLERISGLESALQSTQAALAQTQQQLQQQQQYQQAAAAAQAQGRHGYGGHERVIDTRTLNRPEMFTGEESRWRDWRA